MYNLASMVLDPSLLVLVIVIDMNLKIQGNPASLKAEFRKLKV